MKDHNVCFYGELAKFILELSLDTPVSGPLTDKLYSLLTIYNALKTSHILMKLMLPEMHL